MDFWKLKNAETRTFGFEGGDLGKLKHAESRTSSLRVWGIVEH